MHTCNGESRQMCSVYAVIIFVVLSSGRSSDGPIKGHRQFREYLEAQPFRRTVEGSYSNKTGPTCPIAAKP